MIPESYHIPQCTVDRLLCIAAMMRSSFIDQLLCEAISCMLSYLHVELP